MDPGTETMICVYDIRGMKHFQAITTDIIYEFDLDDLSTGIYLLTIRSKGRNLVHKLFFGR